MRSKARQLANEQVAMSLDQAGGGSSISGKMRRSSGESDCSEVSYRDCGYQVDLIRRQIL